MISAAHCFDQEAAGYSFNVSDLVVRAGATRIDSDKHLEIEIARHVKHPQYDGPKVYYDLALVKLARRVTFNKRVQAICLASAPVGAGQLVTVQGWGKSSDGYRGELSEINVAARWDCRAVNEHSQVLHCPGVGPYFFCLFYCGFLVILVACLHPCQVE